MCEKCENTELRREIEALNQELAAKTELAESLNRLVGTLREENKRLREELECVPKNPDEIAAALRSLAKRMIDVGTAMDYYGGFDGHMANRGRELVGAGVYASEWADNIEEELCVHSATKI